MAVTNMAAVPDTVGEMEITGVTSTAVVMDTTEATDMDMAEAAVPPMAALQRRPPITLWTTFTP